MGGDVNMYPKGKFSLNFFKQKELKPIKMII